MGNSSQSEMTQPRGDFLDLAEQAYEAAGRKLVDERRRLGETIVVWQDGKVQRVLASEFVLPGEKG